MSRHFGRSNSRLYIGNLPEDIKERELEDLFGKFGRIRDIDVKFGRTSNGTAYAFLEFDDPRDAEDAIEARDGCRFGNSRLRVEFTGERRPRRPNFRGGPPKRTSFRVSVTGLPTSASWQDLKDHMRAAGPVGFADARDGSGVVEYENENDMRYAIKKLDGSEFKNPFTRSIIRVWAESDMEPSRRSRGRSTPRSRSRSRSRDNMASSPHHRHRSVENDGGSGAHKDHHRRSPSRRGDDDRRRVDDSPSRVEEEEEDSGDKDRSSTTAGDGGPTGGRSGSSRSDRRARASRSTSPIQRRTGDVEDDDHDDNKKFGGPFEAGAGAASSGAPSPVEV